MSTTNQTNTYFGSAEGDFKSRYKYSTLSFRSRGHEYCTELLKNVWSLKDSNTELSLKGRKKTKAIPYKCVRHKCDMPC